MTCSPACALAVQRAQAHVFGDRRRICEVCFQTYRAGKKTQRTCSRTCANSLRKKPVGQPQRKPPEIRPCAVCGKPFLARAATKSCSDVCRAKRALQGKNARYEQYRDRLTIAAHRRHAQMKDQYVEDVSLTVLYQRDGGSCGVCRKPVPIIGSTTKRDPRMASIDHVVPISEGGEHSYANTRLTHLRCNLARGNRGGGEQLRLFG